MSERNVPFLLNAAPPKADTWTDRLLWSLSGYFRRRSFSGFDRFLSGIETVIDFGGTPDSWLSVGRLNVVLFNIDKQKVASAIRSMKGDPAKTVFPDRSFTLAASTSDT